MTLESLKPHTEFAQTLLTALDDEQLGLIDFDRVKQWLSDMITRLESHDRLYSETELLRQDLFARISGMVKAVAAVTRRADSWESALACLEQLPSLSASDLIEQYRLTSARFRDAFPTSFGIMPARRRGERDTDTGSHI